jgi:hypothetical protein
VSRQLVAVACASLIACVTADAAPGPRAPIPGEPAALAKAVVQTKADLAKAIDEWRAGGEARPSRTIDGARNGLH